MTAPVDTYVVTGSASGIGAAVRARLEAAGARVVGVDLHDADIEVDLASAGGRHSMVDGVAELVGEELAGVVACAGIAAPEPLTVRLNYFGAVATLEGLRPRLAAAGRSRAVAVASQAARHGDAALVDACRRGDEDRAAAEADQLANTGAGHQIYPSSKQALARWVRHHAATADWAGAGIALNAVAPGVIATPMTQPLLDDPTMRGVVERAVPMPLSGIGTPDQIASLIAWLVGPENRLVTGQVVFADGGADALDHPDSW